MSQAVSVSRRVFLSYLCTGVGAAFAANLLVFDTANARNASGNQDRAATRRPPTGAPPMRYVEGGRYVIGTDNDPSALPHTVTLQPFYMDEYEVTNGQFAVFLNALGVTLLQDAPAGGVGAASFTNGQAQRFLEGSDGEEHPSLLIALDDTHCRIGVSGGRFSADPLYIHHPVTETAWRGATAYAAWRGARLPTEAEWEVAARGKTGRTYPWGEAPPTQQYAAIGRRSGETAPVGTHPLGATPSGIHDLAGNVAEWTSSLFWPYPYRPDDGREDPNVDGERSTRGGDHVYDTSPEQLTTFYRRGFSRAPGRGHRHIGFRCAKSTI